MKYILQKIREFFCWHEYYVEPIPYGEVCFKCRKCGHES